MNGWMGNLLRVNLTTKTSSIESSEKYFKYIGGKGMATRIMYDEGPVGTDPAAPENKIVFAVGPNTGSSAPQAPSSAARQPCSSAASTSDQRRPVMRPPSSVTTTGPSGVETDRAGIRET